jgi:hypothetical protein
MTSRLEHYWTSCEITTSAMKLESRNARGARARIHSTSRSPAICASDSCVDGERFAMDFTSTVTELKPQPAQVLPMKRKTRRKEDHFAPDRTPVELLLSGVGPLTRSDQVHSFGHPNDTLSPPAVNRPLTAIPDVLSVMEGPLAVQYQEHKSFAIN